MLAPSRQVIEQRLRTRSQDSEPVIERRLHDAAEEIRNYSQYDYVLVNDDLEITLAKIEEILRVERLKRPRQLWLVGFIKSL